MTIVKGFNSVGVSDGQSDGSLIVADASGFYAGSKVNILTNVLPARSMLVGSKTGNEIFFKDPANPFVSLDLSNYKCADNIQVIQLAGTLTGFPMQTATPKVYFGSTAGGGAGFILTAATTPSQPCDGKLVGVGDLAIVLENQATAKTVIWVCTGAGYAACTSAVTTGQSVNVGAWVNNGANVYICTIAGVTAGSSPTGTTTSVDGTVTYTWLGTTTTYPMATWKAINQA